jgi:hypothetical protein
MNVLIAISIIVFPFAMTGFFFLYLLDQNTRTVTIGDVFTALLFSAVPFVNIAIALFSWSWSVTFAARRIGIIRLYNPITGVTICDGEPQQVYGD